jgi:deazaflavin-dependent oxidoreductase (nitroreductase family)
VNRYTSLIRRLGHQAWFAATARRLVPVDRWLAARTGGRWSVIGRHVLPALLLTTVGRRSGQPRTQPLLYTRDGDAFVVVGSNWGQTHHPAWSANLLAQPEATVTVDDSSIPVRAVHATGAERDRLWTMVLDTWPAYRTYAQRADGRDLRIFRLERR